MYLCIEVVYDNYDYMIADVLHRIRLPDSHNLKRPKTTKSSRQEELKLVSKELNHFNYFVHSFIFVRSFGMTILFRDLLTSIQGISH